MGRKDHKYKEQAAPQPSAGHGIEDVRQGDEDRAGPCRIHFKGKGSGKDNKADTQSHSSIQNTNVEGLAQQAVVLPDIASKNRHRAYAQRKGKEGLSHGCKNSLTQAESAFGVVHQVVEVGLEIEFQSRHSSRQRYSPNRQTTHDQQADHHNLSDLFHTVLKAHGADAMQNATTSNI